MSILDAPKEVPDRKADNVLDQVYFNINSVLMCIVMLRIMLFSFDAVSI